MDSQNAVGQRIRLAQAFLSFIDLAQVEFDRHALNAPDLVIGVGQFLCEREVATSVGAQTFQILERSRNQSLAGSSAAGEIADSAIEAEDLAGELTQLGEAALGDAALTVGNI